MFIRFLIYFFVGIVSLEASALCVLDDRVKLRVSPDAKAKVSWIVGRNMPLVELNKKGAWFQVKDFEGEKHWVHARHVTHKTSCVVVKANVANLRIGPGSNFGQTDLGTVKKYAAFKKVGRDEEWLKIQDAFGRVHWAHENTMWEPRSYSRVSF